MGSPAQPAEVLCMLCMLTIMPLVIVQIARSWLRYAAESLQGPQGSRGGWQGSRPAEAGSSRDAGKTQGAAQPVVRHTQSMPGSKRSTANSGLRPQRTPRAAAAGRRSTPRPARACRRSQTAPVHRRSSTCTAGRAGLGWAVESSWEGRLGTENHAKRSTASSGQPLSSGISVNVTVIGAGGALLPLRRPPYEQVGTLRAQREPAGQAVEGDEGGGAPARVPRAALEAVHAEALAAGARLRGEGVAEGLDCAGQLHVTTDRYQAPPQSTRHSRSGTHQASQQQAGAVLHRQPKPAGSR